ncbi:MAG: phosphopantetheine-binding protein [Desulfatiglans sp.]|jgi:acyl carrier protein|nr:phosphopantetheine-binding protein [Thermodesulfobacteriota bacterium]MEE4353195.1 phosphopantetheine-binding protein [Desulfatiglans sp.]
MSDDKLIEERTMKCVAKVFHKDTSQVGRETRFVEDLFAKSINIIELSALLENEFDIEIPGAEARKNKTVGEAIELIERLLQK